MAGTKSGGEMARDTNKALYGDDFYKKIGAKGGSRKVPKGFALMTYEERAAAGLKGGTISRRNALSKKKG